MHLKPRRLGLGRAVAAIFLSISVTLLQSDTFAISNPIPDEEKTPQWVPGQLIVRLKAGQDISVLDELNKRFGVQSVENLDPPVTPPEEVLKQLNQKRAKLDELPADHTGWYWWGNKESGEYKEYQARIEKEKAELDQLIQAKEEHIRKLELRKQSASKNSTPPLDGTSYLLIAGAEASVQDMAVVYQAHPAVHYAQPNYIAELHVVPDDPHFGIRLTLDNSRQVDGQYALKSEKLDCPSAWDTTTGNRAIVVAVVDSGIDYNHPDILGNIWSNPGELPNGQDDDGNGLVDDVRGWDYSIVSGEGGDNDPMPDVLGISGDSAESQAAQGTSGHGTHVAGIIGARWNNGKNIAGIVPSTQVMPVKIFGFDSNGNFHSADVVKIAKGIRYAVRNGARIINNSWGFRGLPPDRPIPELESAVQEAAQEGVIVLFSAGNENREIRGLSLIDMKETLSISNTDVADKRSASSNYGNRIDLAAPGTDILSIWPTAFSTDNVISGSQFLTGTSQAAPHVAGVIALVLAVYPELTFSEVVSILKMTATPILTDNKYCGSRVHANKAVILAKDYKTQGIRPPVAFLEDIPNPFLNPIAVRGNASGGNFSKYTLYHGVGQNPTAWTSIYSASSPEQGGILMQNLDPAILPFGIGTLRLAVETADGKQIECRTDVNVMLTARAVSPTQVDLSWQDTSSLEAAFVIQRQRVISAGAEPRFVPWYRFYLPEGPDRQVGTHHYTIDVVDEKKALLASGWREEGVTAYLSSNAAPGLLPLHHLYMERAMNKLPGLHYYTMAEGEKSSLASGGWRYDGISGYLAPAAAPEMVPLYHLYNLDPNSSEHFFTSSIGEKDALVAAGWRYENILGYVRMNDGWGTVATVSANVTFYSDRGVEPGASYFYRIKSINGSVESDYSGSVFVQTPPGASRSAPARKAPAVEAPARKAPALKAPTPKSPPPIKRKRIWRSGGKK